MILEFNNNKKLGKWSIQVNGRYYVINGNFENGYIVFNEDEYIKGETNFPYYSSNNFESCLIWCINN